MADNLSWVPSDDKPLEEVIRELNLYFHQFSWSQKGINSWELRIPVYAGYASQNGYILTHILSNQNGLFNIDSGCYFEDDSFWVHIRSHKNIIDYTMSIWEKAIQVVINETSELFQDGNLQIPEKLD